MVSAIGGVEIIIKGTALEVLARKSLVARKESVRNKTRKILENAIIKIGGGRDSKTNVRGVPDSIDVRPGSAFNLSFTKLLKDKLGLLPSEEFEVKTVTGSSGPTLLTSVARRSISTALFASKNRIFRIEDLNPEKRSSAKFIEDGRVSQKAVKKDPIVFIKSLSQSGLKKLIKRDEKLIADITRKSRNLAILLNSDTLKAKKKFGLFFFKDVRFSLKDFDISVKNVKKTETDEQRAEREATGKKIKITPTIVIKIKDDVFRKLLAKKIVRIEKDLNTKITGIINSLDLVDSLALALSIAPGGKTPLIFTLQGAFPNKIIKTTMQFRDAKGRFAKKGRGEGIATRTIIDISSSVQRSMRARMPKGPPKGPPLSGSILTNRTGRFVNSIGAQALADFKGLVVRYFFNPIYDGHVSTARNPEKTIEGSIRSIMKRITSERFRIVRIS